MANPSRFAAAQNGGDADLFTSFVIGPAGFYTAQHLLRHGGDNLTVDIYERLPVPFGLVRCSK